MCFFKIAPLRHSNGNTDPCTFHSVWDGISPAPASRAEARRFVWGGEVGCYIAVTNKEHGFQPKQVCVQHTLAMHHKSRGGRALPESPLLGFDICRYVPVGGGRSCVCHSHTLWLLFGGTKQHTSWQTSDVLSSLCMKFTMERLKIISPLHIANSFGLTKIAVLLFLSGFFLLLGK